MLFLKPCHLESHECLRHFSIVLLFLYFHLENKKFFGIISNRNNFKIHHEGGTTFNNLLWVNVL